MKAFENVQPVADFVADDLGYDAPRLAQGEGGTLFLALVVGAPGTSGP